jgi:hypothetical protein
MEPRTLLAAGSFGLNVNIGPYQSFVNWLQVSGNWGDVPGQTNPITLNASGDPQSDAVLLFDYRINQPWNGPDANAVPPDLSGTYHLAFNGQATVQPEYPGFSTPFTVQNQTYSRATNTTTADIVVPAANTAEFFAIEFTNTRATPASATNTGIDNASLIRPGYAAGSTQLYTNEFLAALAPYSVLRYVEPDGADGQPVFNGNTLVTVDAPQVDQTGMPWEYLVALANQTNTDMWINIPQGATDAYVTALAGIIKNGGTVGGLTYPGLKPDLKIYLEYSNEVWGGIPANETYQAAAVQNNATNQPLSTFPGNLHVYDNPDGTTTTEVYTAVGRRYLERTDEISQIFQSVLGADPTHQRIRPVLGWQENNFAFYPEALDWFEHFFGPASAAFYGMGNANYWSPTDYSSVASIISTLGQQETAYAIPNTIDYTTLATYYGLKNVSYEGGPGIGAAATLSGGATNPAGQNALAASREPAMEQLVFQHYIDYFADGGVLANYFDGPFGIWSPQYEWSAAELAQYGNPTASAKYRGTVDVANAAPVAVTAGVRVSAGAPTSFSATTDTVGEDFSRPATGQRAFWLLNAPSAGTYRLQVTTNANGGTAPGQVEVFLDDKPLGGVINVLGSSTVDLADLPLAAGLNTLSVVVVRGSFDPGQSNPSYYQFQPTTFTLTPTLAATVTALSGLPTSLVFGQAVTFTATVTNLDTTAAVTGWVTFYDGTKPFGSAVVSGGVATFTTSALGAQNAPHSITATYEGSTTLGKSASSAVGVTVSQAGTAVTLSDPATAAVVYGTPLTLTATVTGVGTPAVPTGAVRFYSGSKLVGEAALGKTGTASVTVTLPAGAPDVLTASYIGNADFTTSTSAGVDQEVDPAQTATSLSLSAGSIIYGQPAMFSVSVTNTDTSPFPTGSVTFYLGYGTASQRALGSAPLMAGAAKFTTKPTALPAGSDLVAAIYKGTTNFQATASNTVSQLVSSANTSVGLTSSSSGSVNFGTAVTFTAAVSDGESGLVPVGMVQFWDGTTLLATVAINAQGRASLTRSLARGSHSITAVYAGNGNFNGSTSEAVALTVS